MDGDWQKKNSGEFVENANHQIATGSGAHQVMLQSKMHHSAFHHLFKK